MSEGVSQGVSGAGEAPAVWPVFLKLGGRPVLVVGGGVVAAGKAAELVKSGARVTVVAPHVAPEIAALPGVTVVRREFAREDLEGAWLVVAAAPPEVNRAVAAAGEHRRVFVNTRSSSARSPTRASSTRAGSATSPRGRTSSSTS